MPRISSFLVLDGRFTSAFQDLAVKLDALGFRVFETYRTDDEQLRVFNLGTSKARPGESPHQYGLAVDFVPYHPDNGWYWPKAKDVLWNRMHEIVDKSELSTKPGPDIPWDSPHIEVPQWRALRSEKHRHWLRGWERRHVG